MGIAAWSGRGPSPRIRGEYLLIDFVIESIRTIPANTGRIISLHHLVILLQDHPREYGENMFLLMTK